MSGPRFRVQAAGTEARIRRISPTSPAPRPANLWQSLIVGPGGDPKPPGRVLARHDARDAASAGLGLAPFRPVRRLCSTPRRLMMRPSRTGHAQDKRGFQTGDKQRGDLMLMNIFAVVPAYAGTTLSRWPRIAEVGRLHIVTTSGSPNERINLRRSTSFSVTFRAHLDLNWSRSCASLHYQLPSLCC